MVRVRAVKFNSAVNRLERYNLVHRSSNTVTKSALLSFCLLL